MEQNSENNSFENRLYALPKEERRTILSDKMGAGLLRLSLYEQEAKAQYNLDSYKKSISRVMMALTSERGRGIVVYGDYDADGILSAVMLRTYLMSLAVYYGRDPEYVKIAFSNRQNSFGLTKEEYDHFLQDNSMIITVDNGSSLPFLSESTKGLLVLDHHPAPETPPYPYILNPNVGRKDKLVYSTSGGKVVYNFIANIEENLKKIDEGYKGNPILMEVAKNLAAITLVSDMALLDNHNREFILSALDGIRRNAANLPLYSLLNGDYSSRSLSFNIISPLNALSRMEENLEMAQEWVIPRSLESWKRVNAKVQTNNKKKKKVVAEMTSRAQAEIAETVEEGSPLLIYYPDSKIGIFGLVANQVSDRYHGRQVIVCGNNDAGGIVFSARGSGVKETLQSMLSKLSLPEGSYTSGGHPEACGGHIEPEAIQDYESLVEKMKRTLREMYKRGEIKQGEQKVPAFFTFGIGISDAIYVQRKFKRECEGVDFHKSPKYLLSQYEIRGHKTGPSGWTSFVLFDERDPKDSFLLWTKPGLEEEVKAKKPLIMEFTSNGDFSLHSIAPENPHKLLDPIVPSRQEEGMEARVVFNEKEKEEMRSGYSQESERGKKNSKRPFPFDDIRGFGDLPGLEKNEEQAELLEKKNEDLAKILDIFGNLSGENEETGPSNLFSEKNKGFLDIEENEDPLLSVLGSNASKSR